MDSTMLGVGAACCEFQSPWTLAFRQFPVPWLEPLENPIGAPSGRNQVGVPREGALRPKKS